jgi:hypothetical protein
VEQEPIKVQTKHVKRQVEVKDGRRSEKCWEEKTRRERKTPHVKRAGHSPDEVITY